MNKSADLETGRGKEESREKRKEREREKERTGREGEAVLP